MEEETRERIMRLFDWGRSVFHVAYIPLILYLGALLGLRSFLLSFRL